MIKLSLIISFYKRMDYLKLLFAALEKQSFKDFEIIIADDGSPSPIISDIELLANSTNMKTIHLWHEDKGFRKNKILNQAITASSTDYLVFIDGDCIPHPEFIMEHFVNREEGICLTGRRVNLSQKISSKLTEEKIKNGFLTSGFLNLVQDGIFGKSYDVEKGLYLKNLLLRKLINKKQRGILGCNFSIYKNDLLNINGFDERYEAPSIGEDSDIQYRLEINGIKIKSLNNIAIQYHLYHKIQPRNPENLALFESIKKTGKYYTTYGINKPAQTSTAASIPSEKILK